MKTPDEIKKDAATCLTLPPKAACNRLELYKDCGGDCRYVIKELYDLVLQLESRLAQVERERDAAVMDMEALAINYESNFVCDFCGGTPPLICEQCKIDYCGFKWRGVCAENTKEEK